MRAEKVVASLINAASGVTSIVGTKIYAVLADQASDAPFVVFWKEGARREGVITMNGPGVVYATMSVQCVALDYATLKTLGEAVRAALVGQFGVISGVTVNSIEAGDEGPDFADPELQLYAQTLQFLITHQE